MFNQLTSIVNLSHDCILPVLQKAEKAVIAVDATAGNGKDCLFLAQNISGNGIIYAFDIQEKAINSTKELLESNRLLDKVVLINQGHEQLAEVVKEKVDLVVFNLGYLPGGDHQVITKSKTTIKAVESSLNLLKEGGRIVITIYTGHPGGEEEKNSLENFLAGLNQKYFKVLKLSFINLSERAPFIIVVEKMLR